MINHNQIKVMLTSAEARWLYDLLVERFDEGASTGHDELMCSVIGDKIDKALGE